MSAAVSFSARSQGRHVQFMVRISILTPSSRISFFSLKFRLPWGSNIQYALECDCGFLSLDYRVKSKASYASTQLHYIFYVWDIHKRDKDLDEYIWAEISSWRGCHPSSRNEKGL